MKKRVCAYARVSTNSRGQEHSFEFQSNYWNEKFMNSDEFEYLGLFADKGISGRLASKRPKFLQMVRLVRSKEVDFVYCKSVQRFARNTEELLMYVREFRELGVGVIFEKENINTLTNGNDLYLTIAAAIAEDDLSRYSENMKWTFRDKFSKGEFIVNGRIYGYEMGKDKDLYKVIEEEAIVVRRIYDLYLQGYSRDKICDVLNEEGIPSPMGQKWSKTTICSILTNERYVGDLLLQKEVSVNGKMIKNDGIADQYYIENHHEAIVDRETWNKAQEECLARKNPKLIGRQIKAYPFTGLITCGCCGKPYRHKVSNSLYTPKFDVWCCVTSKKLCSSVRIKDEELKSLFVDVFNEFVENKYKGDEEQILQDKIDKLVKEQSELVRLNANGWIPRAEYIKENSRLQVLICELSQELSDIRTRKIGDIDLRVIEVFDENKLEKFITTITIVGTEVRFEFYNGVVLKRNIAGTRIYKKDLNKIKELEGTNDEN